MPLEYRDIRASDSPGGLLELLKKLGHSAYFSWDELPDIKQLLVEQEVPRSVKDVLHEDTITIRRGTQLKGAEQGITVYIAILKPDTIVSADLSRKLSQSFRHLQEMDQEETFLFIGVPEKLKPAVPDSEISVKEWTTVHISRVYRDAGKVPELRLSRLDWQPRRTSRHVRDCLAALLVNADEQDVEDIEVARFK